MIKKAVIPAAGFGTRFLPITKSIPKEMIPIVDTPVIQYIVEEAIESGITDILLVISRGKRSIEEHFDQNHELEKALLEKEKFDLLKKIKDISDKANIHFIWQKEMNGLGDAIRYAKHHVGNEPFAVLLGDTLMKGEKKPVTKQLIDIYNKYESSVVALEEVEPSLVSRYGVIAGEAQGNGIIKATDWIEKPSIEEAPSNFVVASRYIFTPQIFDFLDKTGRGKNNEIQITDAMRAMVKEQAMYGFKIDGTRYDIGNKLGFLKTNLIYGVNDTEIANDLISWLKDFTSKL